MDYITKPISRAEIRRYSCYMRKLFGVPATGPFPVLQALEHVSEIFEDSFYQVVEDNELPANVMAECFENDTGGFTILIKESVYNGAYKESIGACRGFICHEICHVFLFYIGHKPIYTYAFPDKMVEAYRSVEWQAKALCGELMIPYEESKGMRPKEIEEKYQVSQAFAFHRKKIEWNESKRKFLIEQEAK